MAIVIALSLLYALTILSLKPEEQILNDKIMSNKDMNNE